MGDAARVAVAMSGGVDSSVAAALLLERGYSVLGLTMRLWQEHPTSCGDFDGVSAARLVCRCLGVPHRVVDLRREFLQKVVGYFVAEYARGRTPNPCLRCNRAIKFGLLRDHARQLECGFLATGHYARIERTGGDYRLLCGVDIRKDQSYFLYTLQQEHLRSLLMPLGTCTKAQVRTLAEAKGLPVVDRPESQDICFLGDGDYRRFIRSRRPEAVRPGPIYNVQGQLLGEHKGLPFYTIGQREGLGISAPRPLYVVRLDVARNALIVGYAEALSRNALFAKEMFYVSGHSPSTASPVEAKIRYRAKRASAHIWPLPGRRARIAFEKPLGDMTPGQRVVLYSGEQVLGGGIISAIDTADAPPA